MFRPLLACSVSSLSPSPRIHQSITQTTRMCQPARPAAIIIDLENTRFRTGRHKEWDASTAYTRRRSRDATGSGGGHSEGRAMTLVSAVSDDRADKVRSRNHRRERRKTASSVAEARSVFTARAASQPRPHAASALVRLSPAPTHTSVIIQQQ